MQIQRVCHGTLPWLMSVSFRRLKLLVDHTTALADLLSQHGFHRHPLVRNQVGHFQLVGLLHNAPVDILIDTGAASTVVDLSYCRAKGIPTRDTGKLGGGAGGITLAIHALGRCDAIFGWSHSSQ